MHARILRRMRKFVSEGQYVLTIHAEEEMEDDRLFLADIELCILTGTIVNKQRDRATGQSKFVIHGESTTGLPMAVVARIGPTAKLVVLTVFVL